MPNDLTPQFIWNDHRLSMLLSRRGGGGTVAGLALAPGKTVIVSEEAQEIWDDRLCRYNFCAKGVSSTVPGHPHAAAMIRLSLFSLLPAVRVRIMIRVHVRRNGRPMPGAWFMPKRTSKTGSELFIVDNSDADWKVVRYLHDWCQISRAIDIATGYFEIGALLALKNEWQKVDQIRILMGDEVSLRTRDAFARGFARARERLDDSLEDEKRSNDFLTGVPAIVEAIRAGKIVCRVYRKEKFHAKAYITHARLEVVGSSALVGSSNFTYPGLTENIELNVQITGAPVTVLQEWYEEHWDAAEDVTAEILRVIERHTREYTPFEVYAKALHELHRRQEMSDQDWLNHQSRVYPVLDQYQKDGFHRLVQIANARGGAFLCDGVGLGKTFVGLMLLGSRPSIAICLTWPAATSVTLRSSTTPTSSVAATFRIASAASRTWPTSC